MIGMPGYEDKLCKAARVFLRDCLIGIFFGVLVVNFSGGRYISL